MQSEDFFEAVAAGDLAAVREALADDPELAHARITPEQTPEDGSGWTALHLAAYHGQAEIVRALVEAGADVDAHHGSERSALLVALEYNNATAELLIELGTTVDVWAAAALERLDRLEELLSEDHARATDMTVGLSPLGWTGFFNAAEAAKLLIAHGANVNDGSLTCAASTNSIAVGRVLLEAGAHVDATGEDGATALHYAAAMRYSNDSLDFVELLLEYGANVNAQMKYELTPLDLAMRCDASFRMEQRNRRLEGKIIPPDRNYAGVIEFLKARGGQELSGPQDI